MSCVFLQSVYSPRNIRNKMQLIHTDLMRCNLQSITTIVCWRSLLRYSTWIQLPYLEEVCFVTVPEFNCPILRKFASLQYLNSSALSWRSLLHYSTWIQLPYLEEICFVTVPEFICPILKKFASLHYLNSSALSWRILLRYSTWIQLPCL